jgi:sugar-specific transcriptional regulator TrmB
MLVPAVAVVDADATGGGMSQVRVLKAVCQGYRYAPAIAQAAGLERKQVYAHLRRLKAKNLIYSTGTYNKVYQLKDIGCLLADFWK